MENYITQASIEINRVEKKIRNLASEAMDNNQFEDAAKLFPLIEKLVHLQGNEHSSDDMNTKNLSKILYVKKAVREYPVFSRLGNFLNRTGWSKKYKKEYNQRVDYKYVDLVVPKVLELAKKKEAFEMADLIPTVKEKDGKKVKDYVTYFVISWLKKLGVIEHHGDYGYCLGTADDVRAIVKDSWEGLPAKSATLNN